MAITDITEASVDAAIDEFEQLGRRQFLNKYRMGEARGYYVLRNGRKYDAKAVLAAAHGKIPGRRPLTPKLLHGGRRSIDPLAKLGFEVFSPSNAITGVIPFEEGRFYHRQRDIHQVFSGQERGGISTPQDNVPFVFLFTGENGARYGYEDKWLADGSFEYAGEGQKGPMTFTGGNKAIRDHMEEGKDLLLFEASSKKGLYRYMGSFGFSGFQMRPGKDIDGSSRPVIVFNLTPLNEGEVIDQEAVILATAKSLGELRALAMLAAQHKPRSGSRAAGTYRKRSQDVKSYVLARAAGICESCKEPAPFRRSNGQPYLEPHHTHRLADGGPDHPEWVGAVCPSCHREIHHGQNGKARNETLKAYLAQLERSTQ